MITLGIETTCDETAASIVQKNNESIKILSNIVSSQVKLHSKWGGVVPNLAAREHLKNILPVVKKSLDEAKISPKKIDIIAVANGPGLIPALLIGVNAAKALSYLWKKPLIGVHHIEGHIYANFISDMIGAESKIKNPKSKIEFPVLCLVVSGGHTQLVLMKKHLDYAIIGETLDDAAGEAFDKVARILKLGYPGGPAVAAKAARNSKLSAPSYRISLPRPMIKSKDFNFSFSGLKTAVLYETKKHPKLLKNKQYVAGLCHEFQQSVCDVLISKTISAAKKFKPKTIMLAGGVSANLELRSQLKKAIRLNFSDISYHVPDLKYCIDNGAMIAAAALFRWQKNRNKVSSLYKNGWKELDADANLKLI
jgi:N6-L-threonylcarbamoyladenine synthase